MTTAVPDILARIVDTKRVEVEELRSRLAEFERAAARRTDRRDFAAAISKAPAVIAEIKKASPSKGVLAADFRPADTAVEYEAGGAAALSVLTDRQYFQGSIADLQSARAACGLPVIRKDFTIDRVQIAEAAAIGADAVLLIAALLTESDLRALREYAESLGLAALVEVHDGAELDRAIASGARIIGVNNRDLRTFTVSLDTSLTLAQRIPAGVTRVSESGIFTREDVALLRGTGFGAFLVGESLMKAPDRSAALRELLA